MTPDSRPEIRILFVSGFILILGLPYGSNDPFAIFFLNFKRKFCS